jgi:hypothetical protein
MLMNAISVTELARLQAAQAALLPDFATIRTRTQTTDGQGGRTDTYTTTVVRGRLRPMSAEQIARFADQLAGVSGWVITVPVGTAVALGDQIRVDSVDYDVIGLNEGETWPTALRVYVRRVT